MHMTWQTCMWHVHDTWHACSMHTVWHNCNVTYYMHARCTARKMCDMYVMWHNPWCHIWHVRFNMLHVTHQIWCVCHSWHTCVYISQVCLYTKKIHVHTPIYAHVYTFSPVDLNLQAGRREAELPSGGCSCSHAWLWSVQPAMYVCMYVWYITDRYAQHISLQPHHWNHSTLACLKVVEPYILELLK